MSKQDNIPDSDLSPTEREFIQKYREYKRKIKKLRDQLTATQKLEITTLLATKGYVDAVIYVYNSIFNRQNLREAKDLVQLIQNE